ncbi:unnamed protein product [Brachionus calyciflorus]|uniref:FAM227B n=1 Tax=Brachionus calyciflorus TaxID=104777 RepID=A0A813RZ15_9BILA|nr:unnamed protein product [Brachionus calyciflorus]
MFSFGFDNDKPKEEENEPEYKYEETEFEKIISNINLDDFIKLDENASNDLNPDIIFGDQYAILKILKDSIHSRNDLIDNVEKDILEIDFKIDYYKSFLFEDGKRQSKIKENNFLLKKGFYLTETEIEDKIDNNEMFYPTMKSEKKIISSSTLKKSMENFNYTGFSDHELTELPGRVEAPQLLNNLSNKMGFKKSFLKYWTTIIRTDASIAILLDSFWWFYLKFFKKDTTFQIDAYKFFCRISESFAALLFNIDPSIRDRFFGHYAIFLSQAIYLAFFNVFPDSVLHFNDQFKEEICNIVHEWVLGLRPIPESYLNWNINNEINVTGDTKVSSNNEILSKISNLEKLLNSLGDKEPTVKFSEDQIEKGYRQDISSSNDFSKMVDNFYKKNNYESHAVGEGSVIEMIPFNLKGKSVLINHYLNLHNLNSDSSAGFKMTRSEIVKNPPKTATTYRDKIYETLERAKTLDDAFRKTTQENQNEMRKLEKERKKAVIEFLRLKRSVSSSSIKKFPDSKSKFKKKSNSTGSIPMELNEVDENN